MMQQAATPSLFHHPDLPHQEARQEGPKNDYPFISSLLHSRPIARLGGLSPFLGSYRDSVHR